MYVNENITQANVGAHTHTTTKISLIFFFEGVERQGRRSQMLQKPQFRLWRSFPNSIHAKCKSCLVMELFADYRKRGWRHQTDQKSPLAVALADKSDNRKVWQVSNFGASELKLKLDWLSFLTCNQSNISADIFNI